MSAFPPCRYCGQVPYPPTHEGVCDSCKARLARGEPLQPMPEPPRCTQCGGFVSGPDKGDGLCMGCRRPYESALGPDPMLKTIPNPRPVAPCVRCGHPVLIRSLVLERGARSQGGAVGSDSDGIGYVDEFVRPLALWGDPEGKRPSVGVLQAFVCRACGYTELYTSDPTRIPVGPGYVSEVIDASNTPCR